MSTQRFPRTRIARDLVRLEDEVSNWAAFFFRTGSTTQQPLSSAKQINRGYELEELASRIHEAADFATGVVPLRSILRR